MRCQRLCTSAVLIGLVLAASRAPAQVASPVRQRGLAGIILSTADDSFVLVDSAGNQTTVKLNPGTLFEIDRSASSLPQTIKRGAQVRVVFTDDGITQTVSGSGLAGQLTAPQVKTFLAVSDSEWAELGPRIEKIQSLQAQATDPILAANRGFNNRFANAAPPVPPSLSQQQELTLRTTYFSADSSTADLAASIKAYRDAKAQVRSDLAAARKELQDIVTPRQEALLVIVGILE